MPKGLILFRIDITYNMRLFTMLFIIAALAFLYSYISYQDGKMLSFTVSLIAGFIFIGLMINNIIQVKKLKEKDGSEN